MIQEVATLYKRGRDTILEWKIKVEAINNQVNIFMAYGTIDGEKAIRYRNKIKGKNKGKINETNDFEQALLDAQSAVNLKLKQGYKDLQTLSEQYPSEFFNTPLLTFLESVLPKYNTDINSNEIPMKAQQYYRSKANFVDPTGKVWSDRKYYYYFNPYISKTSDAIIMNFPCFIQPKVNGVRAFVKLVDGKPKIYSKKGTEYNIPQITDWFIKNINIFNIAEEVIFDGELYIPNKSLQNITSAVKAYQLETLNVKYYVFDIAVEDVTQDERFRNILYKSETKEIFNNEIDAPVILIPTKTVGNDTMVQKFTDGYISQGYEGSICRDFKGLYEFGKRPKTMTKLKRTMSDEFIITDIVPAEKDDSLGVYVCHTKEGKEFKVNPKCTEEEKRRIRLNPSIFIGKSLRCDFYEYTDDGIPFHIIDNVIRDYE